MKPDPTPDKRGYRTCEVLVYLSGKGVNQDLGA
jgi:hypothetical protein